MACRWLSGLALLAAGWVVSGPGALAQSVGSVADGPTLFSAAGGQVLQADDVERTLVKSSVIARIPRGGNLTFFGVTVAAELATTLQIAASADLLHVACLGGRVRSGEAAAEAGEVLLFRPGGAVESSAFDVGRFLASSSTALPADIQRSAGVLAERQKSLKFWGALESTGVNARSLTAPGLEPARRSYLRRPAVISLRLRHKTAAALARATAERFALALVESDDETVADLLNPALFVAPGDSFASGDWERLRGSFARDLIRGRWRQTLEEPRVEATDRPEVWYVGGVSGGYAVTLATFDAMTFVNAMRPAQAPRVRDGAS